VITGLVTPNREATVRLVVRGPGGRELEVEATIDTGFDGFLTLPPALVTRLGLRRLSRGSAILANGQEALFDIYGSTVIWDGNPRHVETDAVDAPPLIGMALLYGYDLYMQVVDDGRVLITKASA
jgi:clan AA aspartic protease